MEQKYISVADGELVFDSATHGNLNERNIAEANTELAERAVGCRREAEYYIDKDIKIDKILAYIAIAIGGMFTVASVVMTIVLDWGFFMLIVLSGILLGLGLVALICMQKKQKKVAHIRDCGDLYFAQIVKSPPQLFGAKLKCACVIDGKPQVLSSSINAATFAALQKKNYIIIAYDQATEKFLPVRLIVNEQQHD